MDFQCKTVQGVGKTHGCGKDRYGKRNSNITEREGDLRGQKGRKRNKTGEKEENVLMRPQFITSDETHLLDRRKGPINLISCLLYTSDAADE